ncbi:MAG: hypothetical protein PHP42_11450 [Bacteroidota bacterium]|nr:hypothetical protein [Bacteroidota bacterium]
MKAIKRFVLVFLFSTLLFSQEKNSRSVFVERKNSFGIFAGMGVDLVAAGDVVDYVNSLTSYDQRVGNFSTAVDFFGGVEIPVNDEWGIKIEHSYLFKSYSVLGNSGGTYDFFYAVNAPSVLVQRVISGTGYFVKFGAGGGYHFGSASQTVSTFGATTTYVAQGVGIKAELVGQTAFDENFYGYIGGTIGWEFVGKLKDDKGAALVHPGTATSVSLNYFNSGIRFGVMYYL